MADRVKVGDMARDFSIKDLKGEDFQLSKYKGQKVLLSFHPLAWTSVCSDQMKSLEANKSTLDALNTIAVGISVDSVPCKKAWASNLGLVNTRILADFWPHGGTSQLYGIFRDKDGFSERANVVVDEGGSISFVKVYEVRTLPDIHEIIDFLRAS
jgi:peroxiredoxin